MCYYGALNNVESYSKQYLNNPGGVTNASKRTLYFFQQRRVTYILTSVISIIAASVVKALNSSA